MSAVVLFDLFQPLVEHAELVITAKLLDLRSPYTVIIFVDLDLLVKSLFQPMQHTADTFQHGQEHTNLRDLSCISEMKRCTL